jgi:hypothetical protein
MYNIFEDSLLPAAATSLRNVAPVCMPSVGSECLQSWWRRRFVDGVDTVTLMREAQRWVDQLAIAAVAMLEVDPAELQRLLPPHELSWLLDLHARLSGSRA